MPINPHAPGPLLGTAKKDEDRQALRREIFEFAKMIAWFLVLFLVLKTYVIEGYEVQGPSMRPTLIDNDRILVLKLPHILSHTFFSGWRTINPGDIVVFESPEHNNKRYVKRVIAVGPRRAPNTVQAGEHTEEGGVPVRIEDGAVYVNNQRVDEHGYLTPEALRELGGTYQVVLGPNEYYVLGDNRGVSKDSRSFNAVPDDLLIGKAVLRFWPLSHFGALD